MHASRQSDKVTWWKIGRATAAKYGQEEAMLLGMDIINPGIRKFYVAGALGEPRPPVRLQRAEAARRLAVKQTVRKLMEG